MADRLNRIMHAQYNIAISEHDEFIKYYMDENNTRIWYILLSGFDGYRGEFTDGQYLVRMEFTDKFPIDPPWFYFMTPNGVYKPGEKVCIDIGGYHKTNYPSALGARGFAKQLVSGLIGWKLLNKSGGINIVKTKVEAKQKLAKESVLTNSLEHGAHIANINNAYAEYSVKHGAASNFPATNNTNNQ